MSESLESENLINISKAIPAGLDPNKEYLVRVRSINALGNPSEWSETLHLDNSTIVPSSKFVDIDQHGLRIVNDRGELVFGAFTKRDSRNNLITNPSFETDLNGWIGLSNSSISKDIDNFYHGSSSLAITPVTTGTDGIGISLDTSGLVTVDEADRYTVSAFVFREFSPSNHGNEYEEYSNVKMTVHFYEFGGSRIEDLTSSRSFQITNNEWSRIYLENFAVRSVEKIGITIEYASGQSTDMDTLESLFIDGVMVEDSSQLNFYFDGSTTLDSTSWNGTAHASTSTFYNSFTSSVYIRDSVTFGGVMESENYDGPDGPEIFADAGLQVDFAAGTIHSVSFVLDDLGNVYITGFVREDDFTANTILKADTSATPVPLTVPEQTLLGRITAGVIDALTATEVRTLINVEDGADVTDATNVAAATAVMEGDTTTALMSFVIDEDNMSSDLDTKVPTQQSVKKYVDDTAGASTLAALTDTTITTPASGELLKWSGSSWINAVFTEVWERACSDESTAITTTGEKLSFRAPFAVTITDVRAHLVSACTTGTFTVDINEGGVSILSTKLTIDATELTSTTAVTAAVISDSSIADDAEVTIDVDNVGDSTAKGLKVYIYYKRT